MPPDVSADAHTAPGPIRDPGPLELVKPESPSLPPLLRSVPAPPHCPPGSALVRVLCVGLCRTDLLVAAGEIPIEGEVVLGHEFSGVLEDGAQGCQALPGDLVAVDPTFSRWDGSDGFMGRDVHGALGPWAVVPADSVFRCPSGMPPEAAAYLEPVAAALGGVEAILDRGDGRTGWAGRGPGLLVGDKTGSPT